MRPIFPVEFQLKMETAYGLKHSLCDYSRPFKVPQEIPSDMYNLQVGYFVFTSTAIIQIYCIYESSLGTTKSFRHRPVDIWSGLRDSPPAY